MTARPFSRVVHAGRSSRSSSPRGTEIPPRLFIIGNCMSETWIGLAIGISTPAVELPMVLVHYWRENRRARLLRNLRQHRTTCTQDCASVASGADRYAERATDACRPAFVQTSWEETAACAGAAGTITAGLERSHPASDDNDVGRFTWLMLGLMSCPSGLLVPRAGVQR